MDKENAKQEVARIVEKYEKLISEGKLKSLGEANTKNWLIEPLFEALGWGMRSEEVTMEERVSKGRADYGFRLSGVLKFFVEAKAVKVDLNETKFAKQTIEYGWNKGVTWAVLTDFEGIKVFNCEWNEKNIWRNVLFDLTYKQFIDEFDKIWLLSHESFKTDEIGKYADKIGKRIPRRKIGDYLLSEFIDWRYKLLINLKKGYNYSDSERDEIVQTLLDRLIFIRNCEDRGYEEKRIDASLREFNYLGKSINKSFKEMFRYYDEHYDSKIFEFREVDKIDFDEKLLKNIIERLYKTKDGNIAYDFSLIDADILGNLYEQYLSHISKNSSEKNKAKKKSQGIYYTPTYVVDYIVKSTLAGLLENKKIKKEEIKILDPACGSGSFLIKSFDYLNSYYKGKKGYEQKTLGDGNLTYSSKERILMNNLFGVDLDKQAVEIAQLNLLLKIAEKGHKLPILRKNIQNGNSLINDKNVAGENAFIWGERFEKIMGFGGFDIIIGNPPWVFTRGKHFTEKEKEYFDKYLINREIIQNKKGKNIQSGKLNLYSLFVLRAIDLLKEGGVFGFIIPNNILRTTTYDMVRKYILDNCKILKVVDLSSGVFEGVTASSIILIFSKEKDKKKRDRNNIEIITKVKDLTNNEYSTHKIKQGSFYDNPSFTFNIFSDNLSLNLNKTIEKGTIKLGELCKHIIEGIVGSLKTDVLDKPITSKYKPLLIGKHIGRYKINFKNKYINYDRKILHRARPEEVFLSDKVLVQRISGGTMPLTATLDTNKYYTFASINNILLKENSEYSLKYIVALLNSKLINWYYSTNFSNKSDLTVNISKTFLEQIPIKKTTQENQEKIGQLVERILMLNKELVSMKDKITDRKKDIEEEIKSITKKINDFVYDIYGITDKEKEIIESSI